MWRSRIRPAKRRCVAVIVTANITTTTINPVIYSFLKGRLFKIFFFVRDTYWRVDTQWTNQRAECLLGVTR